MRWFRSKQMAIRQRLIRLLAGNMTVIINAESAGIKGTGVGGMAYNVTIDKDASYDFGISIGTVRGGA